IWRRMSDGRAGSCGPDLGAHAGSVQDVVQEADIDLIRKLNDLAKSLIVEITLRLGHKRSTPEDRGVLRKVCHHNEKVASSQHEGIGNWSLVVLFLLAS